MLKYQKATYLHEKQVFKFMVNMFVALCITGLVMIWVGFPFLMVFFYFIILFYFAIIKFKKIFIMFLKAETINISRKIENQEKLIDILRIYFPHYSFSQKTLPLFIKTQIFNKQDGFFIHFSFVNECSDGKTEESLTLNNLILDCILEDKTQWCLYGQHSYFFQIRNIPQWSNHKRIQVINSLKADQEIASKKHPKEIWWKIADNSVAKFFEKITKKRVIY